MTGAGSSSTSTSGTQTYYINDVNNNNLESNVGTTDRVVSGTTLYNFGWSGQEAPGYFMEAGLLNKKLDATEIAYLMNLLVSKMNAPVPTTPRCEFTAGLQNGA